MNAFAQRSLPEPVRKDVDMSGGYYGNISMGNDMKRYAEEQQRACLWTDYTGITIIIIICIISTVVIIILYNYIDVYFRVYSGYEVL